MYVLGIDGGGTKTKGVIADQQGNILAEVVVGATNPNNVTNSNLEKEFSHLFQSLKTQNPAIFEQVKRVYAGMSGGDHPTAREKIKTLLTSFLPSTMVVTVNNDAITALYSGSLGKPGIVQIAGTGSITFGLNEEGILGRVGGWGHLLGERGSGYCIGSDGLQAAFLAHDGLGEQTELKQLIIEYFEVQTLPDIVHTIYNATNSKELIASLSKLVIKAAENGDTVAIAIIKKNAEYIGEAISCLAKKLFHSSGSESIPVVVTGGLFNRLDLLQVYIEQVIRKNGLQAILIKPKIEPVGGAVIAALLEESIIVEHSFITNFCKIANGVKR